MTEVANPRLPAFDPAVVSETNFTSYPEPHRAANSTRYYRRLGDHAGNRVSGGAWAKNCHEGDRLAWEAVGAHRRAEDS